eukprot:494813-Pleurochrysis_carterae.AAC.1
MSIEYGQGSRDIKKISIYVCGNITDPRAGPSKKTDLQDQSDGLRQQQQGEDRGESHRELTWGGGAAERCSGAPQTASGRDILSKNKNLASSNGRVESDED